MRKLIAVLVLALMVALPAIPVTAAPSPAKIMKITVLSSSGPRTIKLAAKCSKKSGNMVTFHVKVRGVTLISATTKKPLAGRGHVQAYLDRIPPGAYGKYVKTRWLFTGGATNFPLCFSLVILGNRKGKHTIFLALGKTNGVLFKGIPPAKLEITVK